MRFSGMLYVCSSSTIACTILLSMATVVGLPIIFLLPSYISKYRLPSASQFFKNHDLCNQLWFRLYFQSKMRFWKLNRIKCKVHFFRMWLKLGLKDLMHSLTSCYLSEQKSSNCETATTITGNHWRWSKWMNQNSKYLLKWITLRR